MFSVSTVVGSLEGVSSLLMVIVTESSLPLPKISRRRGSSHGLPTDSPTRTDPDCRHFPFLCRILFNGNPIFKFRHRKLELFYSGCSCSPRNDTRTPGRGTDSKSPHHHALQKYRIVSSLGVTGGLAFDGVCGKSRSNTEDTWDP